MRMIRLISKVLRAPRTVFNRIVDSICAPVFVRIQATRCGSGISCRGLPLINRHPLATLTLGRSVILCSRAIDNILYLARPCRLAVCKPGAVLEIGDHVSMSGVTIVAYERIRIGDRTMIGAEAMIMDTDFHPLDAGQRAANPTANAVTRPVEIGSDVFIGTRAIILKGVHIGNAAVIGAAAVVGHDVAAGDIVAGNPARSIRVIRRAQN